MKNFAITTLAVVTLTMLAGDARAQSSFLGLGNLFPSLRPAYRTNYSQANCPNGRCATTGYPNAWNNTGYYGNTTNVSYDNTYPTSTGYGQGTSYGTWYQPTVGTGANCSNGHCTTPTCRPQTPYQTLPGTPGSYSGSYYNSTPNHYGTNSHGVNNITPVNYNSGAYYDSY